MITHSRPLPGGFSFTASPTLRLRNVYFLNVRYKVFTKTLAYKWAYLLN